MIPAELLKKIRRIQIRTAHVVNDALAGQYHSAFRGRGMEFEEVRAYQIGDDVRSIDWNVSARFGHPFVKVFREERELTVVLVVDVSASQLFGAVDQTKRELTAEVCATLALSAIRNNDKVALLCFTQQVELIVPARKGPRHVLRVIRELLAHEPRMPGTDLAGALEYLNRTFKRRAVVFMVSDFQTGDFEQPLRIARRRHDLIPVVITDDRETQLPPAGLMDMYDSETGELVTVDTSSRRVREAFESRVAESHEQRDRMFRRLDCVPIHLRTGEDFVGPLTRYFRARENRR